MPFQGNRSYAKNILDPYLPKHDSHSEYGFMEGGALYAFGWSSLVLGAGFDS
jgi:hypothetical protein